MNVLDPSAASIDPPAIPRRKLTEDSLPREDITRGSARGKSIRYGHPSTPHLRWAPRLLGSAHVGIGAAK
ncbi:putative DNA methylase [Sanguibacter antarcticus]|uniref:Putative DNA methylase n=1 Tax=Sanguibacter antarcticus TaxID=372484 RepID=A0A2A9E878_9MICO|nr:putative DNA methylase [Sanguibacter antarcticus]